MQPLILPKISTTSPSLADAMRGCMLRAGLSRVPSLSVLCLGNPKAWLGTAYHSVLARIGEADPTKETAAAAAERIWRESIAAEYEKTKQHPLNRRFSAPETWPGYFLARASALLRAQALVAQRAATPQHTTSSPPASTSGAFKEASFSALGGKLTGRPDVIEGGEILDYKTGTVRELDDTQQDVVKQAYVTQLKLYGFLVKETVGWWPKRGVLLPLAGDAVSVDLKPEECEQEALKAVALLDGYNSKTEQGVPLKDLASPHPATCKWCPFKAVCPPFWESASPAWGRQLDGEAIEATILENPKPVHNGEALAVSVNIHIGTDAPRPTVIAPVNSAAHCATGAPVAGDRVRMVGLRARPDGALIPTLRTVIVNMAAIPAISTTA